MGFTRLYLTNAAAAYTPATIRGAWDDTAAVVTKALDSSKVDGGVQTFVARAETSASTTWDVLLYRGVSHDLPAQTLSGTLNVVISVSESAADADLYWHLHVYVTQGDSDTPRGTLLNDYVESTTNEWTTNSIVKALQSAQTLSALAISDGDRLVVEIGFIARNSFTSSRTGGLGYGTILNGVVSPDYVVGGSGLNTDPGACCLVFSSAVSEFPIGDRISQFPVEIASGPSPLDRVSQLGVEIAARPTPLARISQFGVEVAADAGISKNRISQLALEIAARTTPGARVSQLTIELIRENREPFPNAALVVGLTWVIVTLRDGVTQYVWADRPLPDPSTYYLGWKEPRVMKWGRIRRALSAVIDGQYETTDFRLTLDDNDHLVRDLEDELVNATMAVYMITDEGRRALQKPITVYRGVIREAKPTGTLQYDLTIKDPFSEAFSSGAEAFVL